MNILLGSQTSRHPSRAEQNNAPVIFEIFTEYLLQETCPGSDFDVVGAPGPVGALDLICLLFRVTRSLNVPSKFGMSHCKVYGLDYMGIWPNFHFSRPYGERSLARISHYSS